MKKIGYLLLAVLNCSVVFGVTLPAGGPLSTNAVSVRIENFFNNNNVGRFTIDRRNFGCALVDNPLTQAAYGVAGVTGVTALSTTVTECGVTDVFCMANQLSFGKFVVSVILAAPLISTTAWNWDLQHRSVRNATKVKDELKGMILDVVLTPDRTARATTWTLTENNIDKFLRFALAQYWSCYRSSSKFERDSFKSALENWQP